MRVGETRIPAVAIGVAVMATFLVGFFVALGVRSVVAGPDSAPAAQVPANPGHSYDQIDLPGGTWADLDADRLDGQDSSAFAAAAGPGRLIELGTEPVGASGHWITPFADVSDCGRLTLMAKNSSGQTVVYVASMSPDGMIGIEAPETPTGGQPAQSGSTASLHDFEIAMPFISLDIWNGNSQQTTDLTAWIWCQP